ncbi:unnamed protein product [Orchesella dallaii]|uniref:Uncharacterized protein n=1 Tax=Orchesella dallaii TaxID=48710 RepID=A0ABP1QHC5_9HEXA
MMALRFDKVPGELGARERKGDGVMSRHILFLSAPSVLVRKKEDSKGQDRSSMHKLIEPLHITLCYGTASLYFSTKSLLFY